MLMDKPIIIKDVLDRDLFLSVYEDLHEHSNWKLINNSYENDSEKSWGVYPSHDNLTFYKASITIKLKILKYIKKHIKLCKIHCNGQTRGQMSRFHNDFDEDDVWTFVLFTQNNWNTQWGGEFVSQHLKTKEYFYTPYIPNTGALIPSNWEHYGQSPNMSTCELRTTIAFCYTVPKIYEKYIGWNDKTVMGYV